MLSCVASTPLVHENSDVSIGVAPTFDGYRSPRSPDPQSAHSPCADALVGRTGPERLPANVTGQRRPRRPRRAAVAAEYATLVAT